MNVASVLGDSARTSSHVAEGRFNQICVRIVVKGLWQRVKLQVSLLRCRIRSIRFFEVKELSLLAVVRLLRLYLIIIEYLVC